MSESRKDPIAEFKSAIVAKAAEALVAELSVEKMREVVEAVLQNALSEISSSHYGTIGRLVKEHAEAAMKAYLATPEAQARVRAAVEEGVNAAMSSLAAETRGKVIDLALAGMSKSLTAPDRRY